jgi:hypothetical protein
MKIHKVTAYVFNFENTDEEEVKSILRDQKHLGAVQLEDFETIKIKDWTDDHPANQTKTVMKEWWAQNK